MPWWFKLVNCWVQTSRRFCNNCISEVWRSSAIICICRWCICRRTTRCSSWRIRRCTRLRRRWRSSARRRDVKPFVRSSCSCSARRWICTPACDRGCPIWGLNWSCGRPSTAADRPPPPSPWCWGRAAGVVIEIFGPNNEKLGLLLYLPAFFRTHKLLRMDYNNIRLSSRLFSYSQII